MSETPARPRGFPAQIIQVLDYPSNKVVMNRGTIDGVRLGARFLVYAVSGDELKDPETGESLGSLEIVRGKGIVTHVQERIATLEPEPVKGSRRVIHRTTPQFGLIGGREEVIEEPADRRGEFDDPSVGDRVKPI